MFLHFDAHTDAYEQVPHFLGAVKSAAHWASYLVRDGYIDAGHSVQIGMRGNPRTLDWRKPSEELGYEVVTIQGIGSVPCAIDRWRLFPACQERTRVWSPPRLLRLP